MLRCACFQRVLAWTASASTNAVPLSRSKATPLTTVELAKMLRDADGRLRCPFGVDFAGHSSTTSRLDSDVRIPFWLALMELHADGYRYGIESNRHLPYVFEKVVDILTRRRVARRE